MTVLFFRRRSAFTLIELLVVIAIIAILAAILFPVFAQAREKARQTACLSNTKQIGIGLSMYEQDFDEVLPMGGWRYGTPGPGSRWYRDLYPYIKSVNVFACPSKNDGSFTPTFQKASQTSYLISDGPSTAGGYGINGNLVGYPYATAPAPTLQNNSPSKSLADIKDSAGTFLIAEGSSLKAAFNTDVPTLPAQWYRYEDIASDWQVTAPSSFTGNLATGVPASRNYVNTPDANTLRRPVARHNGGLNVIYCDGHAKWNKAENFFGPMDQKYGWPYGDSHNSWDDQ